MSDGTHDLTGWTPVQVDTALAEIYTRLYKARARAQTLKVPKLSRRYMTADEIARAEQAHEDAQATATAIHAEAEPYEREFVRRGRWTRAFLVTSSNEGHVHSSMACSTCRFTTEFIWLPEYSGAPEGDVVDDAGERACTACFPSAPVEVRTHATRIFSPKEKQAAVARAEREAARAQREAKKLAAGIANPDGTPLKVDGWGVVATERTAQSLYVERLSEKLAADRGLDPHGYGRVYEATIPALREALAHKRGLTPEELTAELQQKVEARIRRDWL